VPKRLGLVTSALLPASGKDRSPLAANYIYQSLH